MEEKIDKLAVIEIKKNAAKMIKHMLCSRMQLINCVAQSMTVIMITVE